MSSDARAKAAGLPCWSGPVEPEPLTGGITNINFVVRDGADISELDTLDAIGQEAGFDGGHVSAVMTSMLRPSMMV
jgi:hypothetical protein